MTPRKDAVTNEVGPSGFLLKEELEELFAGNQPQPGDVLLLNGDAKTSIASRFIGDGAYSHVGIVVGSDLYIDAVGEGVRVRRIADIPTSGYIVDKCHVARNKDLIMSEKNVWDPALEYYDKPYKLWSIFMSSRGAEVETEPVICSKLVAMILKDVGLGLPRVVQRTFPKHVDEFCQNGAWRRFPLLDYDLFSTPNSVTPARAQYTDSWLEMVKPLHNNNRIYRRLMHPSTAKATKKRR